MALLRRLARTQALLLVFGLPGHLAAGEYFAIQVLDSETGRGVPLVELTTVNSIGYWTDSNGIAAVDEPGFMNQDVYFHVQSHGYEFPKDGFDNRGVKLRVKAGEKATVKIKRLNIAERLYRITGEGIYRDSLLVGARVPLKHAQLNGQVMGQDTVIATPYQGKLYWFWGDTDKASYPLGNFSASGATSEWPERGGLNPNVGIDLSYFVDPNGFSKPMCPNFGPGLQWIESLMTLKDEVGNERLVARVTSASGLDKANAWHIALFNDEKQQFESLIRWDRHDSHDVATPFRARGGDIEYLYLYPNLRVRPDLHSVTNPASYEAFTCLSPETGFQGGDSKIDRDDRGRVRYAWRAGAERLTGFRCRQLLNAGRLKAGEIWKQLRDIQTGETIHAERGAVSWNAFRQRWIMIAAGQPGDVWFAEADTPVGPWVYSQRVVTHNRYNFYNPTHHRFFDQQGGRVIYFEGTYTAAFSGAKQKTPRYDYNQIMYRLSLDDSRLNLPAPVYLARRPDGTLAWSMREGLLPLPSGEGGAQATNIQELVFFALPSKRTGPGLIPVYQAWENGRARLQTQLPERQPGVAPLFLALPARQSGSDTAIASGASVPLHEYRDAQSGQWFYSTEENLPGEKQRAAEPLCRIWPNPTSVLIWDPVVPVL